MPRMRARTLKSGLAVVLVCGAAMLLVQCGADEEQAEGATPRSELEKGTSAPPPPPEPAVGKIRPEDGPWFVDVAAERGIDMGTVAHLAVTVDPPDRGGRFRSIVRRAEPDDERTLDRMRAEETEAVRAYLISEAIAAQSAPPAGLFGGPPPPEPDATDE